MKNQNSLKIFILEDDTWYGNMLQHHLSLNPDYEVKRFESSREFFDRLHEKPDVVTLDYSMPDMDGSEVLKKIREVHPDIQVIIISGQEDVLERGCQAAGPSHREPGAGEPPASTGICKAAARPCTSRLRARAST